MSTTTVSSLLLLSLATFVQSAYVTGGPPLRTSVRGTVRASALPPEFALTAQQAFASSDSFGAESFGSVVQETAQQAGAVGSVGSSPIVDFLTTLILFAALSQLIGSDNSVADSDKDASKAEDIKKGLIANDADDSSRTDFGWLHADMRIPLPKLADLQESCHLIGQHNGHHMYLCGGADVDTALAECQISKDFSSFYGSQVFVCRGPKVVQ